MFEQFDFKPGKIVYNGYHINFNESLDLTNDSLTEDMFQAEYPNKYIIDVGWYFGINKFIIYVIKDCDWENPQIKKECSNLESLNVAMQECINFVKKQL